MKLSDIKGERCLEVIADLIEPCASIMGDDNAKAIFTSKKVPAGMTANEFMLQRLRKSAPQLIRDHTDDIIAILSTIKGVEGSEYREGMTLSSLISDFMELITDEEFLGFLSSSAEGDTRGQQPTEPSASTGEQAPLD